MKNTTPILYTAIFLLVITACRNEEESEIKPLKVYPLRLEEQDYHREITYDERGRLTVVVSKSLQPNDVVLESRTQLFYNEQGLCSMLITDSGYRFEYTYNEGKIVRTDEFINDDFVQYHSFKYDKHGRLQESVSWQNIPEEGGWIPYSKSLYIYDDSDNLINSYLYYFDSGTDQHKLLTAFEFSDYDNRKASDGLFDTYVHNPQVRFRRNNAGRLLIRNTHGNTTSIDVYSYTYNNMGYVTQKTTTTTIIHNGQVGSYETKFIYDVR